jgi:hypothetical protein
MIVIKTRDLALRAVLRISRCSELLGVTCALRKKAEYAAVLKSYRCTKVVGDRYGGEFPREQFQKRGVCYEVGTKVKSELGATD